MTVTGHTPQLTLAAAARIIREAVKDRSYRATPLGLEIARYYRWKKNEWGATPDTMRDYEAILAKLALYHADLRLDAFAPPVGTERLRECHDHFWGDRSPRTRNKVRSVWVDFFDWAVRERGLSGNPARVLARSKARQSERVVYTPSEIAALIAEQPRLRDRLAIRILFHTGIRKGALAKIQFKHFDHARRRLTIFTKGGKVRTVPIVDPLIWHDLERHILDREAHPDEYLLYPERTAPKGAPGIKGKKADRVEVIQELRFQPMKSTSLHRWWYKRLAQAGLVGAGVTHGRKLHWARHTAGQKLLDETGNLKAVQKLLGHSSISTTGDIYTDWDDEQLARVMREALKADS